jgi:hypothetical protein
VATVEAQHEPGHDRDPRLLESMPVTTEHGRLEAAAQVAEKLGLGFHLGSAVERIAIAAGEGSAGEQKLHEATWLIDRYLELIERRPTGTDLQATMSRLAREGDAIAGLKALAAALGEGRHASLRATAPFSTALPEPGPETETRPAEPEHDAEPTRPEPVGPEPESHRPAETPVVSQPSFRRELALTFARALIVIVAVTALVLVLTLIAQLR